MAWVYGMWIESPRNGEAIRRYFSSKRQVATTDKQYKIAISKCGETGSMITVNGISRYGVGSESDAVEMTEIGFQLYEYLKDAPDFRYALVGVEVDGWRTEEELIDSPNDIGWTQGFVISADFYRSIKCTLPMERFKEGYLWLPYEGERYLEIKKK